MSKLLSSILQAREPQFSLAVRDLEKGSGNRSLDVSLSGDILQTVHLKHKELGLDSADTTAKELYLALNQLFVVHDSFLSKKLGVLPSDDLPRATLKVQKNLNANRLLHDVWTIKPARVKKLISALQPKKAVKQLGYRSLDSFIRRESAAQMLFAVRMFESEKVQAKLRTMVSRLKQSDFEYRRASIDTPSSRQWKVIAQKFAHEHKHTIALVPEVSTIIALPVPIKQLPGSTLLLTALILFYANELKTISAQCILSRLDNNFGKRIVNIFYESNDISLLSDNALKTNWRVLHRYYGKSLRKELFEPHLQAEDLLWRSAEDALYIIEPALYFWKDLDYVGWPSVDGIVSFNLLDVALNVANQLPFGSHRKHHMQDSLWNELYLRYLADSPLEQSLLAKMLPYNEAEELTLA